MENLTFAAIKLDTVNHTKADPYRIDIVLVENGQINDPKRYYFNIEDAVVETNFFADLPVESIQRSGKTFAEQWDEIRTTLNAFRIIACFRSGDDFISLQNTLDKRNLPYPEVAAFEAQNIARRVFPELADYQFLTICEKVGLDPEQIKECNPHSVAEIIIRSGALLNMDSLDNLLEHCGIKQGYYSSTGYERPTIGRRLNYVGMKDPKAADVIADPTVEPDPYNFFYQKNVLFTGSFKNWGFEKKDECWQVIANIGGYPQDGMNSYTNVLVEGIQTSSKKVDGKFTMSGKQKDARKRKEKGQDIEIISGDIFFDEVFPYIKK